MVRRIAYIIISSLLLFISYPNLVHAHILVTDTTGEIGAVLHITPDDDPVAGEKSLLLFDIQGQPFAEHSHNFSLTIANEQGVSTEVPSTASGNSISAGYIFPMQGVYTITLVAYMANSRLPHSYEFVHSQRVSRGTISETLEKRTFIWADIFVIISICGIVCTLLIGFNNRHAIKEYSNL